MVLGRTKGLTLRGKGNVVLVAAQLDDPDGNPTEQYVLLRADEFGRLRTVDAGAVATFLGLTDTPASYAGSALLSVRVNAAADALEFAAAAEQSMPLQVGTGAWHRPGWAPDGMVGSALIADILFYMPIWVERSTTWVRIGVEVSAFVAASVIRLGIYNAVFDGNGRLTPDTLLLDAGTISSATNGVKEIVISETLAQGFYYLAFSSGHTPSCLGPNPTRSITLPVSVAALTQGGNGEAILIVNVVDGTAALPDPAPAPTAFSRAGFGVAALRL